jgi:SAM-dependent methyltransferase
MISHSQRPGLFVIARLLAVAALQGCATPELVADPADYEALRVAPVAVTPARVVDEMLALARVGEGDFVVDLGSGDGRLVIAAVARFGASGGFGVDISERAVEYANAKAAEAGVADRVRFFQRDLFATDIGRASVVTVYLFPTVMPRLRDKLLSDLAPGTRVVSHDFPLPDWPVERVSRFPAPEKIDSVGRDDAVLYLYTVPARATARSPGKP